MSRREVRHQEERLDAPNTGSAAQESGNRSLMPNFYRRDPINIRTSRIMSAAPSIPFFNPPALFGRDEENFMGILRDVPRRIPDLIHAHDRGQG